ncbi:GerAB/ArcD/ProY family transporter [Salinithrix halophila]|uniref:GerAB/ArcD/ProY family transporter n=1 Tax=Salinithrix halophila TaxID=1485204 RepID=A0ABV8JJX6_9BACL
MQIRAEDRISSLQATVTIISMIFGTGILTLARVATDETGTPDAWIDVILGGVISLILGYMLAALSRKYPDQTFYQFNQKIAGKFLGWLFSGIMILYFVGEAGYQARSLAEVLHVFLLEQTPIEVLIISFLSVSTYLVIGGINPMVRLFQFLLPLTMIIFVLVIVLSLQNFELDNLRPVLGRGVTPLIKGLKATALSYSGFEIMLLLTAFMKKPVLATRSVFIGISIPLIFYTALVLVAIGSFGTEDLRTMTWPTMEMTRAVEFPAAFFERFETFFITMWTIEIFTTFVLFYYFAALGMGQLVRKNHQYWTYGLLPAIYIGAMLPQDLTELFTFGDYLGYAAYFLAGVVPAILWCVVFIRRKIREQSSAR